MREGVPVNLFEPTGVLIVRDGVSVRATRCAKSERGSVS